MNTGLTTITNLTEIGAEYPFHGMEVIFSIVALAFFVYFFVQQLVMEDIHHQTIIGNYTSSPTE